MDAKYLYGLVLLSALGHASWNGMLKRSSDRLLMMTSMRLVGVTFGWLALSLVGWPGSLSIPWLMSATVALWGYQFLLVASYKAGDLSFVYPLARGVAPVLLAAMSFLTLGETLSPAQISGVILISVGVTALALKGRGGKLGLTYAALIGGSIATYSLLSGAGVCSSGSVIAFGAALEVANGLGVIGYTALTRGRTVLPELIALGPIALGAGVISVAGYIAFLLAANYLPLGPVTAVRECSALFGVLIGVFVLKESFGAIRTAAAMLMILGVSVLATFA
jgi:drug/metabolite transporter (DMT)-like permease